MRCKRCGGRLYQDEPGELACWSCGERLWERWLLMADRILEAVMTLAARDDGLTNRNLHTIQGRPRPRRRKAAVA